MEQKNIVFHEGKVDKVARQTLNRHRSALIWFTGLPASGKSTIANELEYMLHAKQIRTFVLDGDNIRHGLNKGLGFSEEDRRENLRRVGEVSKLFVHAGVLTMAAFVSPYRYDRQAIRSLLDEGEFIEVYLKCDLSVCETRDPKGLYKKARKGEIPNFTGISDPYEPPENPELVIETDKLTIEESLQVILEYMNETSLLHNIFSSSSNAAK